MPALPPSSPAELFGELFHEVQVRRLFGDGKHFVDMVPRLPPAQIMADYQRLGACDDETLAAFVSRHFAPLSPRSAPLGPHSNASLLDHIRATWDLLVREPHAASSFGSELPIYAPYLVPGGRFREAYYWDSYFALLGLCADGRLDLVDAVIENATSLIERFGFIPNGGRTYYLGRSQPPVFYLMLDLAPPGNSLIEKRRLDALLTEYLFWMAGSESLRPGDAHRRVVCMPDGSILNRYWDEFDRPRDESYAEDVITAQQSGRHPGTVYRNLRAAAESGWDFSSRWFYGGDGIGATRILAIAPIDLNCLLYGIERAIARRAMKLGSRGIALRFTHLARNRHHALRAYGWNDREQRFSDCLWATGASTSSVNAAALFPLFTGIASQQQADAMATLVARELLAPGGLRTTTNDSGEQWDKPNGWAPLQWIAVKGLNRYGHQSLAHAIASRWCSTVRRDYEELGVVFEKYDLEQGTPGRGGEYPVQVGFGWTNGVVRALRDEVWSDVNASCPGEYRAGYAGSGI